MLFLLFEKGLSQPTYRQCTHENNDPEKPIISCENLTFDPSLALIPCQYLPYDSSICTTHGLTKFRTQFDFEIPDDGCLNHHTHFNEFGIGVCRPIYGTRCIGERYWLRSDLRCFESGKYSSVTVFFCSLFFGLSGADRFYLGQFYYGILKLFTFGGLGVWYFCDVCLAAFGKLKPSYGSFKGFY